MSIDSSGDQDSGERRTGPTVTRDRWVNHARQKLAKGYVLIVSATRKNANFYSPQKGYEMCAFDVAKKMIAEGLVMKTRKHHLGDVYELAGPLPVVPAEKRRLIDDDDDVVPVEDYDAVLDDEVEDADEEDDADESSADEFSEDEEVDDDDLDEDDDDELLDR